MILYVVKTFFCCCGHNDCFEYPGLCCIASSFLLSILCLFSFFFCPASCPMSMKARALDTAPAEDASPSFKVALGSKMPPCSVKDFSISSVTWPEHSKLVTFFNWFTLLMSKDTSTKYKLSSSSSGSVVRDVETLGFLLVQNLQCLLFSVGVLEPFLAPESILHF